MKRADVSLMFLQHTHTQLLFSQPRTTHARATQQSSRGDPHSVRPTTARYLSPPSSQRERHFYQFVKYPTKLLNKSADRTSRDNLIRRVSGDLMWRGVDSRLEWRMVEVGERGGARESVNCTAPSRRQKAPTLWCRTVTLSRSNPAK